jgi:hypothetical protein
LFGALSFVFAALVFVLVFVLVFLLALLIPNTAGESGAASNR